MRPTATPGKRIHFTQPQPPQLFGASAGQPLTLSHMGDVATFSKPQQEPLPVDQAKTIVERAKEGLENLDAELDRQLLALKKTATKRPDDPAVVQINALIGVKSEIERARSILGGKGPDGSPGFINFFTMSFDSDTLPASFKNALAGGAAERLALVQTGLERAQKLLESLQAGSKPQAGLMGPTPIDRDLAAVNEHIDAVKAARTHLATTLAAPLQAPNASPPIPMPVSETIDPKRRLQALIVESHGKLGEDLSKAFANVGKLGGMSPQEFAAYERDIESRRGMLADLTQTTNSPVSSEVLLNDVYDVVAQFDKPGGMDPGAFTAVVTDAIIRAREGIPGELRTPYPDDMIRFVAAVNASEAIGKAQQDLLGDLKNKAATVGMAGGMIPEEFDAYQRAMDQRLQHLSGLNQVSQDPDISQEVADAIREAVLKSNRPGGPPPEYAGAMLADLKFRTMHKFPGGIGSPYPAGHENLVATVNALEEIGVLQAALQTQLQARAASVGKPGGHTPEDYKSIATLLEARSESLERISLHLRSAQLSSDQVADIRDKLRHLDEAMSFSAVESYVLGLNAATP